MTSRAVIPDKPGIAALVFPGQSEFTAVGSLRDKLAEMSNRAENLLSAPAALGSAEGWEKLPCRTGDPDLFFAESPLDVEAAKALCRACPIQEVCLAVALERREPWGVWGGELLVGGVVVARKRPRGRPRKHPLPEPVAA